ncbi:MAG: radical SAM protein [Bacteroidia bacterium]|nr:radical SAM protein [Bacteroidia bacterium]
MNPYWIYSNLQKAVRNPALIRYFIHQLIASQGKSATSIVKHPGVIVLFVNNYCNCHCIMCDIGKKDQESMFYDQLNPSEKINMSSGLLTKLLNELSSIRYRIILGGAEPLLHPDILALIEQLTSYNHFVSLVTNGFLLPRYASQLISAHLDYITVSIDGPEEIHDPIRGKNTHKNACEGLHILQKIRKKRHSPTIETVCTIISLNQTHLWEHANHLFNNNLTDILTIKLPYWISGDMSKSFNDQFDQLGQSTPINTGSLINRIDAIVIWDQITQLYKKYGKRKIRLVPYLNTLPELKTYFELPEKPLNTHTCSIPWRSTTILADGDVVINNRCLHYVTGNLNDSTITSIWKGARYEQFRSVLKSAGSFPICLRCCGTFQF